MRVCLSNALKHFHSLLPDWVKWLWSTRFGKNFILSVPAWLLLYGMFYIEVSHLDVGSQHAKLVWSVLGTPMGVVIQWAVFGDRLRALRCKMNLGRLLGRVSWRYAAVYLAFFALNQVAYAALLIQLGLPYLVAAPLASVLGSVLHYLVFWLWVTAPKRVRSTEMA